MADEQAPNRIRNGFPKYRSTIKKRIDNGKLGLLFKDNGFVSIKKIAIKIHTS